MYFDADGDVVLAGLDGRATRGGVHRAGEGGAVNGLRAVALFGDGQDAAEFDARGVGEGLALRLGVLCLLYTSYDVVRSKSGFDSPWGRQQLN